MPVKKIISGGQTGADRGGLDAGVKLGLETGGTAPKGYKTEKGSDFSLADLGLVEDTSYNYPPRTEKNVRDSDGTLLCGNCGSPGSLLTQRLCDKHNKPVFHVGPLGLPVSDWHNQLVRDFKVWVETNKIETLNVAGNRESKYPGIHDRVVTFLVEALK